MLSPAAHSTADPVHQEAEVDGGRGEGQDRYGGPHRLPGRRGQVVQRRR